MRAISPDQVLELPDEVSLPRTWARVLLLVGVVTLLRLLFLAFVSPYALVEDEAHYWEWSRRLGWSYYSKGPAIAYAIAASSWLFGATEFGVRCLAPVFAGIGAVAVGGLAADALSPRAAVRAAACFLFAPFFLGASTLMTIDMPMTACWALACWAGWHAIERGRGAAWLGMALALGVGFLFKYTALLLLPGLLIYAIARRKRLRPAWGVVGGAGVLILALIPVVIWNAEFEFPTVRHLLDHLGVGESGGEPRTDGKSYSVLWTLQFVGVQFAFGGTALWLGFDAAWKLLRHGTSDAVRTGVVFLICCAAPVFVFYFLVTFFTDGESNWAIGGHVTIMALGGYGAAASVAAARRRQRGETGIPSFYRAWRALWHASLIIAIVFSAVLIDPRLTARLPLVGPVVPVGRITEGRVLAEGVGTLRERLRDETGLEPILITTHYGLASQLAFYLDGHPTTYCASGVLSGRPNQYDYWDDTDLRDLDALAGRPAILIGGPGVDWTAGFESIGESGQIDGDPEHDRAYFIGYGFQGFPKSGPSAE